MLVYQRVGLYHPTSQATLRAIACGRSAHEHDPCRAVLRPALDAGRTENLSAEWRNGYFFGGGSSSNLVICKWCQVT